MVLSTVPPELERWNLSKAPAWAPPPWAVWAPDKGANRGVVQGNIGMR